MKFLPFIWSGIWRNPSRTVLILLQITVAFVLFGLLNGMNGALQQAIAKQRADVLYVTSRIKDRPLPAGHLEKIRAMPGVQMVNPQNFLVAVYQNRSQRVTAVATDPLLYFTINDYCKVPKEQVAQLAQRRTGAIVGAELVRKYGWKIGDRVPLQSFTQQKDGSRTWYFDVVGIYEYPEEPDMANLFIINNGYFEEARRTTRPGTVTRIIVKTQSVAVAPDIMEGIDDSFVNSSAETVTVSENESAQVRLQSMGDLNFVARAVTAAAFVALLLSVGTMMMQSIRERTPELGVLKALGFSNRNVVGMVLVEVLLVSVMAAIFGLTIAWRLLPYAREYAGLVAMPVSVIVAGLMFAVVLAVVCAWLPARHALKLRVVEALGGR